MTAQERAKVLMDDLKRIGLRLALDQGEMQPVLDRIAAAIEAAVSEDRERCAKIVEDYDETNEDGELVNPGLGYWVDVRDEYCYIPDAEAIAARIREPKRG